MNRLESIKERIENYKSEYLPYFNNNGEMQEWSYMFGDLQYLLQRLEIAQKALEKVYERDGYMFVKDALDKIKE